MEPFDDDEEANDRFDDAGVQPPQMSARFQKNQADVAANFSRNRRGSVSAEVRKIYILLFESVLISILILI